MDLLAIMEPMDATSIVISKGRHKPGGTHYYPALLRPIEYTVAGCDHSDVNIQNISSLSLKRYQENLRYVQESPNETQFKKRRRETGICKPSLFSGLSPN